MRLLATRIKRWILRRSTGIIVLEFSWSKSTGSRAYSLVAARKDNAKKLASYYYSLFPHYHSARFRVSKQKLIITFLKRLQQVKKFLDFLVVSHNKNTILSALSNIMKIYGNSCIIADPVFRNNLRGLSFRIEDKKKEPTFIKVLINIADNAANWFRVSGTAWLVKIL